MKFRPEGETRFRPKQDNARMETETQTQTQTQTPPRVMSKSKWSSLHFKTPTQGGILAGFTSPSIPQSLLCLILDRGFVIMSAIMSSVGQCMKLILPSSTFSRRKWCRLSICLVRAWKVGFFARSMLPRLSPRRVRAPLVYPRFSNSCLSQSAS